MDPEKTALEQQRAAYRAFVEADGERANAESQAKVREVAVEEEIRGENSRKRQQVEARQAQEEKAEEERGTRLRQEEKQATTQREAELNRASRARIEELERLKQQAESRATVSREWANERLRGARNAVNEGGVLVAKVLVRQMDKFSPTAATAIGNPELGLEEAALAAQKGTNEIKAGVLKLESAVRSRRQRLLAGCIAMLVIMVVVGAVVAYQIPSKEKTARRLFNQYQPELNAAYGKNDMEGLKTAYGVMLKDAEKEQIEPENFRQGLKPSWYNELLPGMLDGAKPGALKDFTYYGRIYTYLSKTMTLPEAKGLVEDCWRELGQEKKTECRVNGKSYAITPESVVFSKDKKVLTGEIGEILAGVKCVLRYEGEEVQVIQFTGSRDPSLVVRKEEAAGKIKFSVVDINTLMRQADAEVKNGNLTMAMSLYQDVQGVAPDQPGLAKKIDTVKDMLRAPDIIRQADVDIQSGKLQEAQTLNSEQAGRKEKIANLQERDRAETLPVKADADMEAGRAKEELLKQVSKKIRNYYNTQGEWAGIFTMAEILSIRLLNIGEHNVRAHIKYHYKPVLGNPQGRMDTGIDQRTFDLVIEGDILRVTSMGGNNSASF